ncbi:phosphopantetheine-binding protein [Myxococcus sp. 1LA]
MHQAITRVLPRVRTNDIAGHLNLKELGADSVDRVEILTSILDTLRLQTSLAKFADIRNIDALVGFLAGEVGRG